MKLPEAIKGDASNFDSLFPDVRESGDTPLRQCHLIMLRMLKIFDYLCVKHDVKYFLTGGSLIGAIRHKGFIPWDDDLDVGMIRSEYEKFLRKCVPELPVDIFFQNADTDKYYPQTCNVEARLRDKYSSYNHIGRANNKWHEGMQVDIFIYDKAYLPHNFWVITQNKVLMLLKNNRNRIRVQKFISQYVPLPFVYSSNFLQFYAQMKAGTYITPNEYKQLIRVPFEDGQAYIPAKYDSYLRRQYGDYMQLPPVEKRSSHHEVHVDPFTPCSHSEILYWKDRNTNR
jgi:lipopolysaccharide cholinephosphotransferase